MRPARFRGSHAQDQGGPVSVPLLLLESSIPAGSKALAALVDAKGGELKALFADVDRMLGGDGSAKATQRKLTPLVSAGWATTGKSVTGRVSIRLHRLKLAAYQRWAMRPGAGAP